jgi:hypothetical protein
MGDSFQLAEDVRGEATKKSFERYKSTKLVEQARQVQTTVTGPVDGTVPGYCEPHPWSQKYRCQQAGAPRTNACWSSLNPYPEKT